MNTVDWNGLDEADRGALLARPRMESDAELERIVGEIVANVRQRGDQALLDYSRRFDPVPVRTLWQDTASAGPLEPALDAALDRAVETVRAFHAAGTPSDYDVETAPGVKDPDLIRAFIAASIAAGDARRG